jgi:hypothetical protein
MSESKGPVVGYSECQGVDFAAHCLACASKEPAIAQECKPLYADDIGDFEGNDPGCYECGGDVFPAPNWPEEDELTERRREYCDMLDRDFQRLGLR